MSWLCSRALVEEFSGDTSSDGEPSAQLNAISTPHPFWHRDKTTDFSRLSRFGLTWRPLTEARGEAVLTSFRAGFPARTFPARAKGKESTEPDPGYGSTWRELSERYCRNSSSWRTHQCLWDEALPWSSVTLPRWGMMRTGAVWMQLEQRERLKPGKGSGLLPTLTASDAQGARNGTAKGRTPSAGLTMTDWLWLNIGQGMLHPESAEWVNLWPIGWTDCAPLETAKFRQWQRSHGAFSQGR